MTLNVFAANYWYAVQVSDRRLTLNGQPWDDDSNKCVVFMCRDAIVAITYTGLAYIGDLPTDAWIAGVLEANHLPHRTIGWSIRVLCAAATQAFNDGSVPQSDLDSELTILVAGWQRRRHICQSYAWTITNRPGGAPSPEFLFAYDRGRRYACPGEGWSGVIVGAATALDMQAWARVRGRVEQERDPAQIVGLLLDVVRGSSEHPILGHLIGKDCMAVVLPRHESEEIYSEYLPECGSPLSFTPQLVSPNFTMHDFMTVGGGLELRSSAFAFRVRAESTPHGFAGWALIPTPRRRRPK